jgi:hypothetical protein
MVLNAVPEILTKFISGSLAASPSGYTRKCPLTLSTPGLGSPPFKKVRKNRRFPKVRERATK